MELLNGNDPRVLSSSTVADQFLAQQISLLGDTFNEHVDNDFERLEAIRLSLVFLAAKIDILQSTVSDIIATLESQEGD